MEFITIGNVWIAGSITVALMFIHVVSLRLSRIPCITEKGLASFGGGLAVTYVFLHMLPELVEGNQAIGRILEHKIALTPLADLAIFFVAFSGFNLYYGFELLARKAARKDPASLLAYRLHLATYCLYNVLITYTMPLRVQTGVSFSVIFTIAIGMHLFMADRNLQKHFPHSFTHGGRFALLVSLFLGWLISAVTDPINVLYASLLIAFLSGSILFNVFKEEIPSGKESSYRWFISGAGSMTVCLLILALLKER